MALRERRMNKDVCPKCGGEICDKNGTYGQFYACSNFPKCRFTADWHGDGNFSLVVWKAEQDEIKEMQGQHEASLASIDSNRNW